MTDQEITALAREYAEEGAEEVGLPNCLQNETLGLVATETECVIKWLLRRFALVEKGKVKQLKQCFGSEEVYEVIDMLFPEIAKEVEL